VTTTTHERVTAILTEERAAGYCAAFEVALSQLLVRAAFDAGTRGLTSRHASYLRSAVGGMISAAERDLPYKDASRLRAIAVAQLDETLVRLGKRGARRPPEPRGYDITDEQTDETCMAPAVGSRMVMRGISEGAQMAACGLTKRRAS